MTTTTSTAPAAPATATVAISTITVLDPPGLVAGTPLDHHSGASRHEERRHAPCLIALSQKYYSGIIRPERTKHICSIPESTEKKGRADYGQTSRRRHDHDRQGTQEKD